jgi:hypothetical protein
MDWSAKGYEGGCATSRAATAKAGDSSAELVSAGLPGGAVASEEEFAHLETCLKKPNRPSSTILEGAALLETIGQKRR